METGSKLTFGLWKVKRTTVCFGVTGYKVNDKCYKGRKGFKEVEFNKDEFCKSNGVWQKSEGKKPAFQKRRGKREKRMMVTIVLVPDRRKMANRMCLSEHPFGSIKRFQDSSYFLLRGNRKVTGEFALFSLTYNMQRAINLLGFEEVMRKMTGYLFFSLTLTAQMLKTRTKTCICRCVCSH